MIGFVTSLSWPILSNSDAVHGLCYYSKATTVRAMVGMIGTYLARACASSRYNIRLVNSYDTLVVHRVILMMRAYGPAGGCNRNSGSCIRSLLCMHVRLCILSWRTYGGATHIESVQSTHLLV